MNLACFCVATTVPTTRAICIWLRYVYLVNDADDTRIGWHFGRVEGKRGFLASHEEHRLPDTCTDRIHRNERSADGAAVWSERLKHHQLDAMQRFVLARGDDVADDLCELHVVRGACKRTRPTC